MANYLFSKIFPGLTDAAPVVPPQRFHDLTPLGCRWERKRVRHRQASTTGNAIEPRFDADARPNIKAKCNVREVGL